MPCGLPADDAIPIGQYGSSNIGRAKTVYRTGLSNRYGRRMQAISGIHYNWSLPGLANADYFALIRNFRRHGWLLFYLFGASPAVCSSFVAGHAHHGLQELRPGTLYLPHATTLRMGRLGYQSEAQDSIATSCNDLESYGAALEDAMTRIWPAYEKVGVQDKEGNYLQLSTALLQIENEFYGKIRPKCVMRSGERPLHALRERGVEYVEVRLMDLDPFAPVGITPPVCRFLDIFLLHCLRLESPPDTPAEIAAIGRNQEKVAARGREPGLMLARGSQQVALEEWGGQLIAECAPLAAEMDATLGGSAYREAHAAAAAMLADPALTPVRARAGGDGRGTRQLLHRLRARPVARAARRDHRAAPARRSRAALRRHGGGIPRPAKAHGRARKGALRRLAPALPVAGNAPPLSQAPSNRRASSACMSRRPSAIRTTITRLASR